MWFLGAFTGSNSTNLLPVIGTINTTFDSSLQLTFDVIGGTEYQIAAVSQASGSGPIQLSLFLDALELRRPRMLRDGLFALDLRSTVERLWIIKASTNLVHWTPVAAGKCADGTLEFLDPTAAGHPVRFYRAVEEPMAPEVW
jgi:hypothetical protein